MSHLVTHIPEVVVKPLQGKMLTIPKLKAMGMVLILLVYVYLLLFIKTFYLKSRRLDRILEMALETEKKMLNVHNMDQNLAMRMAQIDKMYEDY